MSQGQGNGGPPENPGNGNGGPPAHAGPPDRVRERIAETRRNNDGDIVVSDHPLDELANNVDWDNLTPFEEYVLAVLNRNDLL